MNPTWSEGALADIAGIEAQHARNSSRYAAALIARIFARGGELADQPFLGPVVEDYGDGSLRELLEHPYRIIYRVVGDNTVEVVGVFNAGRRLPRGL